MFMLYTLLMIFLESFMITLPKQEIHTVPTGTLTVHISGMASDDGVMRLALYNSVKSFPGKHPYRGYVLPVRQHKAVVVAENLPFGEYAVAVFHDENNNEELDRNFLGIPTERYGFSNNARGIVGPPSFEQSKIILNTATHAISLEVR
jgi:uncharacterized protein (DUF2141 family)